MASGKIASWALGEEFLSESSIFSTGDVIGTARERGSELGIPPLLAGAGASLRATAAMLGARSVVEVGTGTGVGSLYILSGMAADGVLTTIDSEPENHRVARQNFAAAGIGHARVRAIGGRALNVLGRLTPNAYDMVVLCADHPDIVELTELSLRLLRRGGVLVLLNVMFHDRVADPTQRDATTVRIRELLASLAEDERYVSALSPSGDGVLTAIVR